jgi:hypothetical protein
MGNRKKYYTYLHIWGWAPWPREPSAAAQIDPPGPGLVALIQYLQYLYYHNLLNNNLTDISIFAEFMFSQFVE